MNMPILNVMNNTCGLWELEGNQLHTATKRHSYTTKYLKVIANILKSVPDFFYRFKGGRNQKYLRTTGLHVKC